MMQGAHALTALAITGSWIALLGVAGLVALKGLLGLSFPF